MRLKVQDLEKYFGREGGKKVRKILNEMYLHNRYFSPEELSASVGLAPWEIESLLLLAMTAGLVTRHKRPGLIEYRYHLAPAFRPGRKKKKKETLVLHPFALGCLKRLLDLLAPSYPSSPPSFLLQKAVDVRLEAGGWTKAIRRVREVAGAREGAAGEPGEKGVGLEEAPVPEGTGP